MLTKKCVFVAIFCFNWFCRTIKPVSDVLVIYWSYQLTRNKKLIDLIGQEWERVSLTQNLIMLLCWSWCKTSLRSNKEPFFYWYCTLYQRHQCFIYWLYGCKTQKQHSSLYFTLPCWDCNSDHHTNQPTKAKCTVTWWRCNSSYESY